MALFSVGAIGITGLYAAYLRVGSLQALVTSIYGQALLLKQVFVAAPALAGGGKLAMDPASTARRLRQAGPTCALMERFGRMVLSEIILGCLLLLSVSLLTYLPPAKIMRAATS